jgi:hypothetical protein
MTQKRKGNKTEGAATRAKRITFSYGGNNYVLEFTCDSVRQMERQGFDAHAFVKRPLVVLPEAFAGAFIVNHPLTSPNIIKQIYMAFDDKAGLVGALATMLSSVYDEICYEIKSGRGLKWERRL